MSRRTTEQPIRVQSYRDGWKVCRQREGWIFGTVIFVVIFFFALLMGSGDLSESENPKVAKARRRSESIDHWSEVVNNDDWQH